MWLQHTSEMEEKFIRQQQYLQSYSDHNDKNIRRVHAPKLSLTEIRMLRQLCGRTRKIRSEKVHRRKYSSRICWAERWGKINQDSIHVPCKVEEDLTLNRSHICVKGPGKKVLENSSNVNFVWNYDKGLGKACSGKSLNRSHIC